MVSRGWGGEREINKQNTENYAIMRDISHYIFVQNHGLYNNMSEP